MLVVTTENIKGYKVTDIRGQMFGVVVRSRGLGGNIVAGRARWQSLGMNDDAQ